MVPSAPRHSPPFSKGHTWRGLFQATCDYPQACVKWSLPAFSPHPDPWNSFHQILGCSPQPSPCNTRLLLPGSLPRPPTDGLLLPSLATLRSCLKWSPPASLDFPLPSTGWSLPTLGFLLFMQPAWVCGSSGVSDSATSWTESRDYLSLHLSLSIPILRLPR